jgi:hypothetical protein
VWHTIPLRQPNWQYLTKQGNLLFIDFPCIYFDSKTEVKVLVKDISARRFPFSLQDDKHNIYGLWTDNNNLVYVAVYGGRQLKRIDKEGQTTRIFTSDFLWSPVNGVFDKNNDLWLMECRIGGAVRICKIKSKDLEHQASFLIENITFISLGGILILLLLRLFRNKKT